ncbi:MULTISPECIES: exodeoxyribonuclease VII small subunit [unclassified Butyrivibrio]|uniref:exodeoxyribonuclease VII small subunit n=1 Tax=unclassified Butyrivibrio TaxID=2639466 RepID=UPI000409DF44|nr:MULTISPECIES: exodeoxyribonuclease VII small subunit [unclassified Butyrivibrio]
MAKKTENIDAEENKNELSVEEAFDKIDATIKELEKNDVSLEESFKLFKEGMDLLKYCNDSIDKVEKKVQKVMADGQTEDFD